MEKIKFQETLLTLPPELNRYDYHRLVSDTHSRGAPPSARDYIYDIRPLGRVTAATLRSDKLPAMLNPQSFHLLASQGQEVSGSVVMSFVRRNSQEVSGRRVVRSSAVDDPALFVQERLQNCGLDIMSLPQTISLKKISVNKGRNIIPVDFGRVNFTAKIVDLEKLSDAYLLGVGRQKAFGFGMIYLPSLVREGE